MPLASLQELFLWFYLVLFLFASPVGPYQIPHELVQIVGKDRPGTGHLQRVPQTFCRLVEPIFVRLQGANDPFGLAALASDRLADGLGNAPRPVALGLDAYLCDALAGQRPQGRRGRATPVVDQQGGSGVRTKNLAVPCQRLQGIFDSSTTRGSPSQTHSPHRGDSEDTAAQTRPLSPPCGAPAPAPASHPHGGFCPWPLPRW